MERNYYLVKTVEEHVITRKVVLERVDLLRVAILVSKYPTIKKVSKYDNKILKTSLGKKIEEKAEVFTYHLKEIEAKDIQKYRKNNIPSFVLKIGEKFFYTRINRKINISSATILGMHQCAHGANACDRLLAASDENGGCKKVRDRDEKAIEKYPWIKVGYETFNTKENVFAVVECEHYTEALPRNNLKIQDINKAKLSLAQFMYDDVENLEDARNRKIKNDQKFIKYR